MVPSTNKFNKILLIDDNPIDNLVSLQFITAAKITKECITIDSSLDAYDYIDEVSAKEFPEIILLDLNMPMYNGFEFLEKIEKMVDNKRIKSKVYILSSSNNPKDLLRANTFKSVAGYFTKPLSAELVNQIA